MFHLPCHLEHLTPHLEPSPLARSYRLDLADGRAVRITFRVSDDPTGHPTEQDARVPDDADVKDALAIMLALVIRPRE